MPEETTSNALPSEFTLNLGPRSVEHVAAIARVLRQMGANVEIESAADGKLVAKRPA